MGSFAFEIPSFNLVQDDASAIDS